jgi:hypothetical protein
MLQFPRPGKGLKTAVIRRFGIGRKTASRQLFALEMILKTLAANPFSGTSLIGTGAVFQIAFFFAFHPDISFEKAGTFHSRIMARLHGQVNKPSWNRIIRNKKPFFQY